MPVPQPTGRTDSPKRKQKTLTKAAPIFTRSYDLYIWLLNHTSDPCRRDLADPMIYQARKLLECITLALQDFAIHHQLCLADEALALLRLHLRVAHHQNLLVERQ